MDFIFTIILFVIAFYVIWSAIKGEGKMFATENIYEDKIPQFKKILRILYGCMGLVMFGMAFFTGAQTAIYNDTAFTLNDQFEADYAEYIDEEGVLTIEGLEAFNVNDAYPTATMSSILQGLPSIAQEGEEASKTMPIYYEEVGRLSIGETQVGQNEFFTACKEKFSVLTLDICSWVCMGLSILGIVALFIIIRKFTDKEKQKKTVAQANGSSMPSSAFDFDNEPGNE